MKWREWAGSLIGLMTPGLFLGVYWFWTDSLKTVLADYSAFFETPALSNPWKDTGSLVSVVFLIVFLFSGLYYNFSHLSEKTVETRKKMILLNWYAVWVIATVPFAGSLLFFHPGLAFIALVPFLTNLYFSRKKTLRWELLLWAFILVIAANQVLNLLS